MNNFTPSKPLPTTLTTVPDSSTTKVTAILFPMSNKIPPNPPTTTTTPYTTTTAATTIPIVPSLPSIPNQYKKGDIVSTPSGIRYKFLE